jgi:spore coat polysaccharide biosynthesis protein SpsF
MPDRVVGIVQARMGSTRLYGKVLRRFGRASALEHQLQRLRQAKQLTDLIVATGDGTEDAPIADLCARLAIDVVRGSAHDVLDRFRRAAHATRADVIVRLTADCPLIDPGVVDRIVDESGGFDYTSNTIVRSYPRGLDAETFRRADLEAAAREAVDPYDREHVTPFFYRRPDRFKCSSVLRRGASFAHWRWTLDEPLDAAFFDALFQAVGDRLEVDFNHDWLVAYLEEHPALRAINAEVEQRGPALMTHATPRNHP